jgi:hypothetical protein
MHMIKYKNCLVQQDNKTLEVTVSKNGRQSMCYAYTDKLSGKELRTVVNRYLAESRTAQSN